MTPIKKSPSQPILYSLITTTTTTTTITASPTKRFDFLFFPFTITETMRRRAPTTLFFVFLSILFFAFFSLLLSRNAVSGTDLRFLPAKITTRSNDPYSLDKVVNEKIDEDKPHHSRRVSSIQDSINSVSILLPDWEVLVVVTTPTPTTPLKLDPSDKYTCLYPTEATSEARFIGVLPSNNQTAFKCSLPSRLRRHQPFPQPILAKISEKDYSQVQTPVSELNRWSYLVYESFSTEEDVVLFVKGVNHRQGFNRSPNEFKCVFGDQTNNSVKTAVTSSVQEVFRCHHPKLTAVSSGPDDDRIKVSLEITHEKRVVPSVAYYAPLRKIAKPQPKSLICASTMVYNVAKFLREWVMYHSKIGVEKFILYDNDSDDNLESVVKELNQEGYNVETLFWIWPKTQEAGFSHSAIYARDSCTWMMYVDVDEFLFSPSWENSLQPSDGMLKSLLPRTPPSRKSGKQVGQVSIKCNDFGPSNQVSNPVNGVTQGYNCRRRVEQRHKSIVLLDAVDYSLLNVIHHFGLNQSSYKWNQLSLDAAVVNHYKYQAWSEFKTKFRRRVSAYVVDWKQAVNLKSKDRTPGLGFQAVEPKGWAQKFCEVHDDRLKLLTRRWFRLQTSTGQKMAWQRLT